MNNFRSAVLLGIGITAAALIWFKVSDDSPTSARDPVTVKVSNNKNFAVQNSQPPQTESRPSNKPDSYPSQRLNKLFTQATDYRVFISEALQHPEEGGLFYAQRALEFCIVNNKTGKERVENAKSKAIAKNGTLSPEGIKAADAYLTRCANMTPEESWTLEEKILSNLELQKKDPLLQAMQFDKAGNVLADHTMGNRGKGVRPLVITDSIVQNMQQMLDTQDTMALSRPDGLLGYIEIISASTPNGGMWFNGELVPKVGDTKDGWNKQYPLRTAVSLSLCKIGPSCELLEEMQNECAMQNCFSSLEDFVRFRTNRADGTNLVIDRAIALEPQVTAAIRNRDVKAFLPRK